MHEICCILKCHSLGTSNWTGDYFTSTTGIGLYFEKVRPAAGDGGGESSQGNRSSDLIDEIHQIFDRGTYFLIRNPKKVNYFQIGMLRSHEN